MTKPNPKNERIKRRYMQYLRSARRLSEASIDKALAAVDRYEDSIKRQDFAKFHIEKAMAFKSKLDAEINPATGRPLSKGTTGTLLKAVRAFHIWLADQEGYRSRIRYSDADYFNASNYDRKLAKAADTRPSPSLDQVHRVLARMPTVTSIDRRNRAIVAFLILTGVRDGAAIGLKLRHVDLDGRTVRQDPREIGTKFAKAMTTTFFPVGGEAEAIVAHYIEHLRREELWSPDDPLFPKTRVERSNSGGFRAMGLDRAHWSTANALRDIVKNAFEEAGMPPYGPHSFRKTLARLGEERCRTPEEMKAWSQNLGHEDVLTTFRSYGQVHDERQREIMSALAGA